MRQINHTSMTRELFALYALARTDPAAVSDQQILAQINKSFWITNASDAVSQTFCIIAPACLLRPHLTAELIRTPMEALIACGCEEPESVFLAARHLLESANPYVMPDSHGQYWLSEVLPELGSLVDEVFRDVLRGCME